MPSLLLLLMLLLLRRRLRLLREAAAARAMAAIVIIEVHIHVHVCSQLSRSPMRLRGTWRSSWQLTLQPPRARGSMQGTAPHEHAWSFGAAR
jgi:hypothetical protein